MGDCKNTKMIVSDQVCEVVRETGDWRPADVKVSSEAVNGCARLGPVDKQDNRCLDRVDECFAEAWLLLVVPGCRVLELCAGFCRESDR